MTTWTFRRTDSAVACLQTKDGSVDRRHGRYLTRDVLNVQRRRGDVMVCAGCFLPRWARLAPLTVSANVFFDARAAAQEAFHTTELAWRETTEEPELVVTWAGHDAGRVPGKCKTVTRRA
jgi:hypothetical protein